MELTEKNKNEVREHIIKELEKVPDGVRIKLDKNILEDFIFYKYYDKYGNLMKLPICTGDFIRKLDLSEISFENVILTDNCGFENVINYDRVINKFLSDFRYQDGYTVIPDTYNFSGSNANIIFEDIYSNSNTSNAFTGIFSYMDLSNSRMDNPNNLFYNCDFLGCKLPIKQINWKNLVSLNKINKSTKPSFCYCNFSNTGLKITFNSNLYKRINPQFFNHFVNCIVEYQNGPDNSSLEQHIIDLEMRFSADYKELEMLGDFFLDIRNHHYDGCYINGNLVIDGKIHKPSELDDYLKQISDTVNSQLNNKSK